MNNWKLSSFIFAFLKKHIGLLVLLIIAILTASLSSLVPSYILRYIIDNYFNNTSSSLIGISLIYFFSYFLIGAFDVFESYMISLFGQKLIHTLRYEMTCKLHRLKANYFTFHTTGEIESRIMDDVYAIESLFASGLVSILVSSIKIIGIVVSIFTFSWMLGLLMLCLLPLIFFITSKFRKGMLKLHTKNQKLTNEQSSFLSETIDSKRTISNLNKEKYMEDKYAFSLEKSYKVRNKSYLYDSLYSPIINIIKDILIAAVTLLVFYGSKNSDFLSLEITVGTYAASITLISNIFTPISELGQELEEIQEGVSGTKRVKNFMNEEEMEEKDKTITSDKVLSNIKDNVIEIKNLHFHYQDSNQEIFTNFNLDIKNLDKITFIGRTGAGKTTLFKLILGIEKETSGSILINGYEASKIPDSEKREIFGYVSQSFSKIPGTIKDQITLKDSSISLEKVKEVMKEVFLDSYVEEHIKGGYEAIFNENDFSQGQLQLLSLARALAKDPKILLLDEISANLDSKTEKELIDALNSATNKRTLLSISHRLSDEIGATRIVEIKN